MDDDVEIPGMDDDLDMAITDDTASDDMIPSIGDDLEMAITDDTASDDSLPGMDDDTDVYHIAESGSVSAQGFPGIQAGHGPVCILHDHTELGFHCLLVDSV